MTKVLHLDDSLVYLSALKLGLESENFSVKSCTSKRDFYNSIQTFNPDVILIDVFQEKIDGRILCQHLIDNKMVTNIPIILISENPYALLDFRSHGASESINKADSLTSIVEKINNVVMHSKTTISDLRRSLNPLKFQNSSFSSFARFFF